MLMSPSVESIVMKLTWDGSLPAETLSSVLMFEVALHPAGRVDEYSPSGVGGLSRVLVKDGDSETPLVLLFADDETALRLWTDLTPAGPLVVYGHAVLRSAEVRGSTIHLTGDVTVETGVEVWGPRGIDRDHLERRAGAHLRRPRPQPRDGGA
ncbi:hypothetical protein STENM223S_05380 [Streptomyces tendae]